MRQLQHTLADGLRRAADLRLILPLYLTGLALGLAQSWPAARARDAGPLLEALALGEGEAMVRLLLADGPAVGRGAGAWLLLAALAALLYSCAYNLFSGGLLSVMAGRAAFWPGCARFFWSFTGLGALLLLLAALALAAAALAGALAGLAAGLAAALALLQLVGLLGEYGRALAVTTGRRSPVAALGGAARFVARRLPGALALAALGLLLHLAVAAAHSAAAGRAGYAAPLAQQLAALAWLWVKQLRLGWALAYVEAADGGAPAPRPALAALSAERGG